MIELYLTRNVNGSYQNHKWLIYRRGGWWYLYGNVDGEYTNYCGMYKTLTKAKEDATKLDGINY